MKHLLSPLLLIAASCGKLPPGEVTPPAVDTTPPNLILSMFDPSVIAIASSDPNQVLERGCPAGSSANFIDVEAYFDQTDPAYIPPMDPTTFEDEFYFYKSDSDKIRLLLFATDPEGLFSMGVIAHAHPSEDARAYDFDTRGNIARDIPTGDYTPSTGTFEEYVGSSPIDPNITGSAPIYSHDLRIQPGYIENENGSVAETFDGTASMIIAPRNLSGGPVIYASATNAADSGTRTRLIAKVLPRSLCRPDEQ